MTDVEGRPLTTKSVNRRPTSRLSRGKGVDMSQVEDSINRILSEKGVTLTVLKVKDIET